MNQEQELQYLRRENMNMRQREKEFMVMMESLNLIYESKRDDHTLNWILKIKHIDFINSLDFYSNLSKYLHIEEVK